MVRKEGSAPDSSSYGLSALISTEALVTPDGTGRPEIYAWKHKQSDAITH